LIAELSYRCPLECLYCSNPLDFASSSELSTEEWIAAFRSAAALGVVQLHLSGGEPTVRKDLEALVRAARGLDLYTNLITGGTLLDEGALSKLKSAGLDHVQLSLQSLHAETAVAIAGRAAGGGAVARKIELARTVRRLGLPLTLNVVLHRLNLGEVPALIALAREVGADRLELANTQYYAWALENRALLMPSRSELDQAEAAVRAAVAEGGLEIAFVRADYFFDEPKACMGGWARSYVLLTPSGEVLPCHAARAIPGLEFENVRQRPLEQIWASSSALEAFRGEGWMQEPCKSCERRAIDFGGCRCQAFLLAGDAAATDPACKLSPQHDVVLGAVRAASAGGPPAPAPVFRNRLASRRLAVLR
jgi:pyrroloquinoline quinone biosynthesis protein E